MATGTRNRNGQASASTLRSMRGGRNGRPLTPSEKRAAQRQEEADMKDSQLIYFDDYVDDKLLVEVPEINLGGECLRVWYMPSHFNDDLMADVDEFTTSEDNKFKMNVGIAFLTQMVGKWSFINRDGSEVPINEEFIRRLGILNQTYIMNAIMDDINLGEGTAPR